MEPLSARASDGVRLAVYRDGRGVPLYAVHGGPASDHRSFGNYLAPAREYAELVLLDQRGCGESEDSSPDSYTLERLAADIEDVREALGHRQFVLLAHSFGGVIAVRYALRWPEKLMSLVFVDAAVSGWKGPLSYLPGWPAWFRLMLMQRNKDADWAEFHVSHDLANQDKRDEVRALLEVERRYDPRRIQPLISAGYHSLPLRPIAANVRVLGIYGQHAGRFLGDARQLQRAGATVVYIKGAGHFPFVEQPEAFHAALRAFVTNAEP
jgi:pimeloyl-ACP methyl ester carboxylesterase